MEISEKLRAGLQLFGRDVGQFRDLPPRLDWAFLDYRHRPWLGLRAGIIKMPFGLYNEYADVDSARLSVLLPQSVYSLRNRSTLLAHTGFSLYGSHDFGPGGALDYQAFAGTLDVAANALELDGAALEDIETKYVAGAQVFWQPPIEGLRVGASALRASIDFFLRVDAATVQTLIMAGLVPADYDGALVISQRPVTFAIASAEYVRGDWVFAAEYARSLTRQRSSLPELLPTVESDNERFYVMASRRLNPCWELGAYYSVLHADAGDRRGRNMMKFPERFLAFQRDATATLRFDVNEHWLWKIEAHFIDGAADLFSSRNPSPERYWGLFLIRTTVMF
jgi:hypothetical protein